MLERIDGLNAEIGRLIRGDRAAAGPVRGAAAAGRVDARLGPPLRPGRPRRDRPGHEPGSPPAATWPPGPGATPLDHQSGKRAGRARHKKGNRYLAAVTGETAVAAGKTQTREGARYRRLARSRGKAKAQVALGNTQLRVYHKLLSNPGMRYQDLGPDYYERQAGTRRKIAHHVARARALGLEVTLARIPDPEPARPATTRRLTHPPTPDPTAPPPAGSAAARPAKVLFSGQRALAIRILMRCLAYSFVAQRHFRRGAVRRQIDRFSAVRDRT